MAPATRHEREERGTLAVTVLPRSWDDVEPRTSAVLEREGSTWFEVSYRNMRTGEVSFDHPGLRKARVQRNAHRDRVERQLETLRAETALRTERALDSELRSATIVRVLVWVVRCDVVLSRQAHPRSLSRL